MVLIQHGRLHTMTEPEVFQGDILLRDGKIAAIASEICPEDGMEVVDARGLEVYPGFIDPHSHIGLAEEQKTPVGDPSNESTNPVTPALRGLDGVNPLDGAFHNALAAGVTGVMAGPGSANPIGGQFCFLKTAGRRVDEMVVLECAAMKVAFGENPISCYGPNGNMPSTRMGTASLIREELFRARQYLEDGNETDYKLECWRAVFERKIPLKAHVHRTDDIFTAIRIAREFELDLTLDHCTQGHLIAEEISESGFPAIVGPSLASRTKEEVNCSDFKTPGILQKVGVLVALTTDHPVSRIQYLPLCAALAAKEGLGEWEALRAITYNAAKISRVEHRLGTLEVGKDADVVLWRGSPLLVASSVEQVFVNGRSVWPVS